MLCIRYYAILYFAIPCCIVRHCAIVYCYVSYYTVLHCRTLGNTLYHVMVDQTIPYEIIPYQYRAILYCIVIDNDCML